MPDFNISEIRHASGRVTYLVSGSLPGEGQVKKRFETRAAADSAKLDFDRKRELPLLKRTRREVRLMETTLAREQLVQARAAFALGQRSSLLPVWRCACCAQLARAAEGMWDSDADGVASRLRR